MELKSYPPWGSYYSILVFIASNTLFYYKKKKTIFLKLTIYLIVYKERVLNTHAKNII